MKKIITAAMFAAAVAITAGAASAQTTQLKADIPFAFHAGDRTMPAGRYFFRQTTGNIVVYQITSEEKGQGILVLANSPVTSRGAAQPARVVFECGSNECMLSELWPGLGGNGHRFVHHATPREKEYKQVAILLTSGTAR